MGSCWGNGLGYVGFFFLLAIQLGGHCVSWAMKAAKVPGTGKADVIRLGVLDREGNARKVVNCSCVVVRDWGEESQERSILLNYFQTEQ